VVILRVSNFYVDNKETTTSTKLVKFFESLQRVYSSTSTERNFNFYKLTKFLSFCIGNVN